MITRKQMECLRAIDTYVKSFGYPPSYSDLRISLNLASNSGVIRLIGQLQECGFINRLPYRRRALEITEQGQVVLGYRNSPPVTSDREYFIFDPETQTLKPVNISDKRLCIK